MIAAVALMLSAGPTAANAVTGNVLLEKSGEYEKHLAGQDAKPFEIGMCLSYIHGVWDMIRLRSLEKKNDPLFENCPPDGTMTEQGVLVVIKYLKENPADLHHHAIAHITEALQEAWPCN